MATVRDEKLDKMAEDLIQAIMDADAVFDAERIFERQSKAYPRADRVSFKELEEYYTGRKA